MRGVVLVVMLSSVLSAAQLYGTVYDQHLNPASKALVTVNSTPVQKQVTENGTYSLMLPAGQYQIKAYYRNLTTEQNITIQQDGQYRLDLIVLFDIPNDAQDLADIFNTQDVALNDTPKDAPSVPLFAWVAVLVALLAAGFWFWGQHRQKTQKPGEKSTKTAENQQKNTPGTPSIPLTTKPTTPSRPTFPDKPLTTDQKTVLSTLDALDGRAPQKELRKHLGQWSEAKVSLELTELEDAGVIRKIKKGRGNIIKRN